MQKSIPFLAAALALSLASCSLMAPRTVSTNLIDASGKSTGSATFTAQGNGTRVQVKVSGLTPGMHGMHIHANPSCANTTDAEGKVTVFGGAGGHFDPENAGHHAGPMADNKMGHAGDIPMLNVGADGVGTADFYTEKVSLKGQDSVIGHSIIIHAAPDDYKTDPSGNSGARERCGILADSQK